MPTSSIPQVSTPQEAINVAHCLIQIANSKVIGEDEAGKPVVEGITNLKLQKMLYFAQATHLALFDKPLFKDEIQAWSLGPVVPTVYHALKNGQNQPLDPSLGECDNPEVESFLQVVWELFGKYSASELVNMTHKHTPWLSVYRKGVSDIVIPQDSIRKYYKESFNSPVHA